MVFVERNKEGTEGLDKAAIDSANHGSGPEVVCFTGTGNLQYDTNGVYDGLYEKTRRVGLVDGYIFDRGQQAEPSHIG